MQWCKRMHKNGMWQLGFKDSIQHFDFWYFDSKNLQM